MPAEAPIFVVFGDFGWAPKRDHFPKTDSCNENARFCTFRTQIVLAYFSKNAILTRKTIFLHDHPKNTIFWVFFKASFLFFHIASFGLSNIKKTKRKMHFFSEKPFFYTLTNCQKKICSRPYTLFVLLRHPKKTTKLGKKQTQKKSWTDFQLNLGQIFSSRNAKSWTDFQLYSIYVCIYIIICCGVIIWATFGGF